LTDEKGVSRLVQQWPKNVHLDIIGDGPVGAEIDHLIRDRGEIRRLGLMDRHDLVARLGRYQGIVVPSLWGEGLPTVILEALACGVPSVVSRHIHSAPSLASEGVAAIYDPDGGTHAVASALSAVVGGGAPMRRAAVDLHRRRYSPTAWQENMDPIYSSIARP
jgi:glycosyltransferase involved in cell wall biosynthesis